VVDLIHAGKLDEAELAARDLQVNFPHEHDGYDRLGMVHQARGDHKQAVDCYRKALVFIQSQPDRVPQLEAAFQRLIDELDPPATD
jgi:tetratricopeptide (TPR) repeat protein